MDNTLFTVKVDVSSADEVLKKHGLNPGGAVQAFFTNEIMRLSDDYAPFANGVLKNSAYIPPSNDAIIYNTPYARYHWYGKLMVDPITGKGAFFSPTYGFWSRPNTPKVLTNRNMQYQEAPLRGPRWVERCWLDNKDAIIAATEKTAREYKK